MRTRLLNLLLLTALVLAVVRFQAFLRESPQRPSPEGATVRPPAAEQPLPEPAEPAAASRTQGYDVIVARDLFSPERGVVPPTPAPPGQPASKAQSPPRLTLFGVVILDGEKYAYLHEGAQDTKPRKVHEGDPFAGGTVVAIRRDAVTFLFGGSEIAVPLRTPKEGIAQVPASQPLPPGASSGGAIQTGSAPIPRRVPRAIRSRTPVDSTLPPGVPPAPARRFPPTIVPGDESVVDVESLTEEEAGDEDQQYPGEEGAEE